MSDVIEMQILNDDKPIDMSVNFSGEFVSGADGGEYERGYEDGKNSVGNPLEYAVGLAEAFYNAAFPDGYELTLNVPNIATIYSAFNGAKGIKKIVIKGNTAGNGISFNRAFRICTVETIDLTEFNAKISGDMTMAFYSSEVVEILGEIDFSNVSNFYSTFGNLSTLVTITPKANTIKISINLSSCNKLSDISIQSIIDGLADLTGGTAQTLDLHSDIVNKLSIEQLTQIANKNWRVT